MTERHDDNAGEAESADPGAPGRPTPSPKAQAASRARRIGGRPQPGTAARPKPNPARSAPLPTVPTGEDLTPEAAEEDRTPPAEQEAGTGVTPTDAEGPADARDEMNAPEPVDTVKRARGVGAARLASQARKQAPKVDGDDRDVHPAAARSAPGWLDWLPAAVLVALVVAVLVLGVVASHGVWWAKKSVDTQAQRQQVLSAAKSCLATMNTYDYRKLDEAETKGAACTTGKFTAQYKTAIEKVIKPQAAKVKFTQAATVNKAGIESVSKDGKQWVVLVFGQLSTTKSDGSSKTPTPQLAIFSARATMQQVDGHWLVASYQYAPSS